MGVGGIRDLAKMKVWTGLSTLLFLLAAVPIVFSAPPASKYTPGETLEPVCAPGDTNCTVIAPAKSGVNDDITEITALSVPLSVLQGGTGTSTAFTAGSIIFAGTSGIYNQNNSNLFWDNTNSRLGIGTTTPQHTLNVDGTLGAIHLKALGRSPTISAGPGAGTGPTVNITGSDIAGTIQVVTGTLPSVESIICTITFDTSYGTPPHVVFVPGNAPAALLSGLSMIFSTTDETSFSFTAGPTALVPLTTYRWNYIVVE